MVESYSVSSTLRVKDELTPALQTAGAKALLLYERLAAIGKLKMPGFSFPKSVGTNLDAAAEALKKFNSMTANSPAIGGLERLVTLSAQFASNMKAAAAAQAALRTMPNVPGAGGAGQGGRGRGGGPPPGPVPPGPPSPSPGGSAKKSWGSGAFDMMFAGSIVDGWGDRILGFMKQSVDATKEYQHQIAQMSEAQGMSQKEIADAIAAAWKNTGEVMTMSVTDSLKTLVDLKNIFGDVKMASTMLPIAAKANAILQSASDGRLSQSQAENVGFSMFKALDIRGATVDPTRAEHEADLMVKVINAMQGRVTPEMFQGVFQYARQAKFDLSDDFAYGILPTLMLEMSKGSSGGGGGGSRGVGPALAAFYRVAAQGYVSRAAVPLWERLGLKGAGNVLETTTPGTVMAPVKERGLAEQNPFEWATTVLDPAIKKYLGTKYSEGAEREIVAELFKGNQLAASMIMEFITKPQNFSRDQRLIGQASGISGYNKLVDTDPDFAWAMVNAQFKTFLVSIGPDLLKIVVPALKALAGSLHDMAIWATKNPDAVGMIMKSLAGLGVFFVSIGTAMSGIGSFLVVAQAATAIGGLAVALAAPELLAGAAAISAIIAAIMFWKGPDPSKNTGIDGSHAITAPDGSKVVIGPGGKAFFTQGHPSESLVDWWNKATTPPQPPKAGTPMNGKDWNSVDHMTFLQSVAETVRAILGTTQVTIDGKVVGQIVTKGQEQQMTKPPTSTNSTDAYGSPNYGTSAGDYVPTFP
jgi:hypothetical protein